MKNNIIYHYCSTESFFSIISNKCLRLSDITKTNDHLEKEWALNLQDEVLENILDKIFKEKSIDFDPYKKDDILGYGNFFDIFKVCQEDFYNSPAFIACFSKNGDLLSQWRGYAADGTGISIGFNELLFYDLDYTDSDFNFMEVIYKKRKQIEIIKTEISEYFDEIKPIKMNPAESFGAYIENNNDWICPRLALRLLPINYSLKNTAFAEECEKRVMYIPKINIIHIPEIDINKYFSSPIEMGYFQLSPIKYRAKPDEIIAYCELNFNKLIDRGIISEIIIGPKSKSNIMDIYGFMKSFGYDINPKNIKLSTASYK